MLARSATVRMYPEIAVTLPRPNYNPPFNITRASHVVLDVKDVAKSRAFYVDLIG